MNIVLFEPHEISIPLPASDRRAVHITSVLRCGAGDSFDAGIIGGARGKATIEEAGKKGIRFSFTEHRKREKDDLFPVTLIVGSSRPQTMRKILNEAASLGVGRIVITGTEKSEKSYRRSRLWTTGEYRRHLILGAEQAFSTKIPEVDRFDDLASCLRTVKRCERIALDNYEATIALSSFTFSSPCCVLAVGPENGWSASERRMLLNGGFVLARLGTRVLRTETACVAGISLVLSGLGLF